MLHQLALSVAQLGDRAILAVIAKSLALTLALLALLGAALVWLAGRFGEGWFAGSGAAAQLAAGVGAILAAVLLFRSVAMAVVGLFADDIVEAVERRHYPDAARTGRDVPFGRSLRLGIRSFLRSLLWNLLALPLYLLLLVTGVGAPLVFVAVNALLLGRDLGEMVGARHLAAADLKPWLAASRGRRATTGLVAAILFVVPVVNLLAPVIGAAFATHRFHGMRRR